jgi:RNA polymerase sigma-70 factor (ECF subfamily)
MSSDPLDMLLAKLGTGDFEAARQVCQMFEPYLRLVVRRSLPRQLRTKFDSVDVVQSIWLDVLKGFRDGRWHFATLGQLKAFLVRTTRNRLIDTCRKHGRDSSREQPLWGADQLSGRWAGPSEVAQAEELWSQMLDMCPEEHHDLLELRRQGYSLVEIAARTGLHEGSVRRILYDLARGLAATR